MSKIITIAREFASGGREVGKRLADELSINYYDRELTKQIAKTTGFDEGYLEQKSEQYGNSILPYMVGRTFMTSLHPSIQTGIDLRVAEQKVLKKIAEKENAVIIGRCADYVLQEYKPFKVFIYASDFDYKINRCYEKVPSDKEKSQKDMKKEILHIEKQRNNYYLHNTNMKWADMSNYHLCIDTSMVGVKGAVAIIISALEQVN